MPCKENKVMLNKRAEYVGKVFHSSNGEPLTIVDYRGAREVTVEDSRGNAFVVEIGNLKKSNVKNPYAPTVYGVGYIGVGEYKSVINRKITKPYKTWNHIMERCYSEEYHSKYETYKGCEICEQWHNFQNFAEWYNENYYEVEGERMELDKDILCKGNKVYSPDNCVFVPQGVNSLFIRANKLRGDLPIGVTRNRGRLMVSFSKYGKQQVIYGFNNPIEAFNTYKRHKEQYIKEVAECYKPHIPTRLYEAMLRYEVEITD